jgi:4-amino-4-deoxy-L-arabinose transferase-like glycosyltransferase
MLDKNYWRALDRYALPILILASVILRILMALYLGNEVVELPGTFDQISYHQLAMRVASGKGFSFGQDWWPLTRADQPTAHWSYLYTLFLAAVYKLIGIRPLFVRIIQALIVGILQPYLAFLLGRTVMSRAVGLISAGLTAGYAYFIYYSGTLMTEPFFITAILAALYLTVRISQDKEKRWEGKQNRSSKYWIYAALGIVLGLAVLFRQVFLLAVPFLIATIWWFKRKESMTGTGLATAFIILMILPFTIYNLNRFHRFVLLNTNAGYAFFWANHPVYGTQFQPILSSAQGSYQDLIPLELRNLDEAALDQELLKMGFQFVLQDPLRYTLLSISRIPAYFMFWPSSESSLISNISRVGSFGILLPWIILGIVTAMKKSWANVLNSIEGVRILLLFCLLYSGIHILTWALVRYRLPVDAVLVIFAALGFQCFGSFIQCRLLQPLINR